MIPKRRISLRVSVTDRCQLRCFYCMPACGVPMAAHSDILSFEEITRFVHILKSGFELTKVHITGGEPLVRRNIVELIAMLASERVPDLALTTNGQALDQMANDLKRAGLHRVNISLDSLNQKTYTAITCGGALDRTLGGIECALRAGLPVKLNTVVLRNYNAVETPDLAQFALERGCQIRFLELMPIGCAGEFFDAEFIGAAEIRKKLAEHFTLTPVSRRLQDSHKDFLAEGRNDQRGIIGFISPHSEPFCAGCTRLRLTSTGELIPCLAHGDGTNIRHLLGTTISEAEGTTYPQPLYESREVGTAFRCRPRRSRSDRPYPHHHITEALHNPIIDLVTGMLTNKGERDSFRTTRAMACVGG